MTEPMDAEDEQRRNERLRRIVHDIAERVRRDPGLAERTRRMLAGELAVPDLEEELGEPDKTPTA